MQFEGLGSAVSFSSWAPAGSVFSSIFATRKNHVWWHQVLYAYYVLFLDVQIGAIFQLTPLLQKLGETVLPAFSLRVFFLCVFPQLHY